MLDSPNARRFVSVVLLLTAYCLVAAAIASAQTQPTRDGDAAPTREEKREARELAVHVVTLLKETGDAERVAAEFFIEDFAERFRRFVTGNPEHAAMLPIDHRVVARAEAADLRRAYIALLNLWVQYDLASDYEVRLARSAGSDRGHGASSLRDTLPADFFDESGTDPLVAAIKLGFFGREPDAEEADERAMAARIHSVDRLRSFTAGLEACVEQIRRAVGRLRAEAEVSEYAAGLRPNPEDEREVVKNSIYRIESEALEKEESGLPAGPHLIRVRAWPYVVLLVRRDGQLRVLSICPDFDGD